MLLLWWTVNSFFLLQIYERKTKTKKEKTVYTRTYLALFYKSLHGETALHLSSHLVRSSNNAPGHREWFIQVPGWNSGLCKQFVLDVGDYLGQRAFVDSQSFEVTCCVTWSKQINNLKMSKTLEICGILKTDLDFTLCL